MHLRATVVLAACAAAAGCGDVKQSPQEAAALAALLHPDSAALAAPAPDSFAVGFQTSAGKFEVTFHRAWSPAGAARVYYLVQHGFYSGSRFYRVVKNSVVQFGVNGRPEVSSEWQHHDLPDEPLVQPNVRGIVTFADEGPGTRTTQLFINLRSNKQLDEMEFAGVGEVTRGWPAIDSLYSGYGETDPPGSGPSPPRIEWQGNDYLEQQFPRLDSIVYARVIHEWRGH